ncbi:hypothetical protein ACFV6E_38985 [Streptomyces sp. NPDC059785]|uniref:hypothetical protein n=1 Tax=unclassified Streptomyces TaxID=2593676 RepID=UPI003646EF82
MAKNKNRKQGGQPDRSAQAEQAQEQARTSAAEAQQSAMPQFQSPGDGSRKQRRFGHN